MASCLVNQGGQQGMPLTATTNNNNLLLHHNILSWGGRWGGKGEERDQSRSRNVEYSEDNKYRGFVGLMAGNGGLAKEQ